jgi:hypothetical protein
MPPKGKYYDDLFKAVGADRNDEETRLFQAQPVKNQKKAHFGVFEKDIMAQADLVFMPFDQGYRYLLTVTDVFSKAVDAVPLENKSADVIEEGMRHILSKSKYISGKKLLYLYTDNGSEFTNPKFKEMVTDEFGIVLRHTMPYRKNQTGPIEHINGVITAVLQVAASAEEIKNGEVNRAWVDKVPQLVKAMNEKAVERFEKKEPTINKFIKGETIVDKNEDLLKEGDLVHVALQVPKDHLTGKRMNGKFRNGDQRYDRDVRAVERVAMYPNQPVRYILEGMKNVSFLRGELLRATENENVKEATKKKQLFAKFQNQQLQRKKEEEEEEKNAIGYRQLKSGRKLFVK